MQCVRCQTTMKKAHKEGVLIDKCPNCGGLWLDGGEVAQVQQGQILDAALLLHAARAELAKDARRPVVIKGLCPKCQTGPLEEIRKRGVEIDYCPHCHGTFFDDKELEASLAGRPASFVESVTGFFRRVAS